MRKRASCALIAATALATAVMASPAVAASTSDTSALRDAVTVKGIMKHENALRDIADANGGTRASGTPGFESKDYVVRKVQGAG